MKIDCFRIEQQDILITGSLRSRRLPSCSLTQNITRKTLGSLDFRAQSQNNMSSFWDGKLH